MTIRYILKARKKQTDAPELELGFRVEFRKYDWSKKHTPPFTLICSEVLHEKMREIGKGKNEVETIIRNNPSIFKRFGKGEPNIWYNTSELKEFLGKLGIKYE